MATTPATTLTATMQTAEETAKLILAGRGADLLDSIPADQQATARAFIVGYLAEHLRGDGCACRGCRFERAGL